MIVSSFVTTTRTTTLVRRQEPLLRQLGNRAIRISTTTFPSYDKQQQQLLLLLHKQQKQQRRSRQQQVVLFSTTTGTDSQKNQNVEVQQPLQQQQQEKEEEESRPYHLVIVESPSKVATISKILQEYVQEENLMYDFQVTSCMGHIRNLEKKKNNDSTKHDPRTFPYPVVGVDLKDNLYEPSYVVLPQKQQLLQDLQSLVDASEFVLLATDPDREGEAIAWHLQQLLLNDNNNKSNSNSDSNNSNNNHNNEKSSSSTTTPPSSSSSPSYARITFSEITPRIIKEALLHQKDLDYNLIEAQETRRVLDRLAGYTMSPILWKKIAPGLSAGRVQSVGMALVVQRERERLAYVSTEYWDIDVAFQNNLNATIVTVNDQPLANGKQDFETNCSGVLRPESKHKLHLTEQKAHDLVRILNTTTVENQITDTSYWKVIKITSRQRQQSPPHPFSTSTLQQESNKRLGMSVSQTMRTAQQLYEKGLISYMRTDSTHLSEDARNVTCQAVRDQFGAGEDVPAATANNKRRKKKNSLSSTASLNVEEAHEAIRPAIRPDQTFLSPDQLDSFSLPESSERLYQLIYRRTLASHMRPQVSNQTTVTIQGVSPDGEITVSCRASGRVIVSPGYTRVWGDTTTTTTTSDDNNQDNTHDDRILPPLVEGQNLDCLDVIPESHKTQPPSRYTEASFVKELEAKGVGRPSTYAGIVQILRDRAYIGSAIRDTPPRKSSKSNKAVRGAAIIAKRAAGGGEEFTGSQGEARGPLVPSLSAFVVTNLLEQHCPTYVDPGFTAQMEERLDWIALGEQQQQNDNGGNTNQRVNYLNEFYAGDDGLAAKVKRMEDTVSAEEARRVNLPALFKNETNFPPIALLIGPWGPYMKKLGSETNETAQLPPGMAADLSTITPQTLDALFSTKQEGGVVLGDHPDDGRTIRLKVGRFGAYLQWGETGEDGTTTHSLPRQIGNMQNLDLEAGIEEGGEQQQQQQQQTSLSDMLGISLAEAVGYVSLPRTVSTLDDKPIIAAIGPYGPYLKYNNKYMRLKEKDGDVLTIDAESAEELVTEGIINMKSKTARGVLVEVGEKEGSMVTVKEGRFGMYMSWKRVNVKIPPEYLDDPSELPLEEAWSLIQEKRSSGGGGGGGTTKKSKRNNSKKNESTVELPLAPKRPKSAYLHFCDDKRPEVSKTTKSLGEISKQLAQIWAEVSSNDRKPYEQLAKEGKEQYEKEKLLWKQKCEMILSNNGEEETTTKRRLRNTTTNTDNNNNNNNKPKRPKSAYLFFCDAKRSQVTEPGKTLGQISKELSRLWAETTDRDEYEAWAAGDKIRYQDEMKLYKEEDTATTVSKQRRSGSRSSTRPSSSSLTNNNKKMTTTTPQQPRSPSPYILFCREYRPTIVDEKGNKLSFGDTSKRLGQMWKNCDSETRAKFVSMSELAKLKT